MSDLLENVAQRRLRQGNFGLFSLIFLVQRLPDGSLAKFFKYTRFRFSTSFQRLS
jgi:hypothetical protein